MFRGKSSTEDFIRLHALALEGYDAIAYYDSDCEFQVPDRRWEGKKHGKLRETRANLGKTHWNYYEHVLYIPV